MEMQNERLKNNLDQLENEYIQMMNTIEEKIKLSYQVDYQMPQKKKTIEEDYYENQYNI